jgi:hypothetical protein
MAEGGSGCERQIRKRARRIIVRLKIEFHTNISLDTSDAVPNINLGMSIAIGAEKGTSKSRGRRPKI